MAEVELKRCPFCGGEADIYSVGEDCHVMCDTCRCRTPSFLEDKYAIEAWNRRAENKMEQVATMISEKKVDIVARNLSENFWDSNKSKIKKMIAKAYIRGFKDGVGKAENVYRKREMIVDE